MNRLQQLACLEQDLLLLKAHQTDNMRSHMSEETKVDVLMPKSSVFIPAHDVECQNGEPEILLEVFQTPKGPLGLHVYLSHIK